MRKIFTLLILTLFLISFASAHTIQNNENYNYKEKITTSKYYADESTLLTIIRYADYENDDRYSTYDYRNGYSYRETEDYWDDHYGRESKKIIYEKHSDDYYDRDYDDRHTYRHSKKYREVEPSYSVKYVSYLRDYKVTECYDSPPRGKLFYIKCP